MQRFADAFESMFDRARMQALHGSTGESEPIRVTPEMQMNINCVNACVRILAGSIAQLPIKMYERDTGPGGMHIEVKTHPIAEFLRANAWCPWMTRFEQMQLAVTHKILWGNAYSEMIWERGTGHPLELLPKHPATVTPLWSAQYRDRRNRPKLVYQIQEQGQDTEDYFDGDILCYRNMSTNGIKGGSLSQHGQQTAGLAWHQEKIALDFCTKSAKPSIVVKVPGMVVNDRAQFIRDVETQHASGKPLVLEYGSEASTLDIPFAAAQLLDSRKFQTRNLASYFGVMPHQLGDTDGAKYDNVEALDANFVKYTLVPILIPIAQEFCRKLLTADEQLLYFFEFNVDALLRGAQSSRYKAYELSVGWQKIDEIRSKENLPALENGAGEKLYQKQIIADPYAAVSGAAEVTEPPVLEIAEPPAPIEEPPAPAKKPQTRQRYEQLARSVLEGLFHTEKVQLAGRVSAHGREYRTKLDELATTQRRKHAEKFPGCAGLLVALDERYEQLARCESTDGDVRAEVEMCLHGLSIEGALSAVMAEWETAEHE